MVPEVIYWTYTQTQSWNHKCVHNKDHLALLDRSFITAAGDVSLVLIDFSALLNAAVFDFRSMYLTLFLESLLLVFFVCVVGLMVS